MSMCQYRRVATESSEERGATNWARVREARLHQMSTRYDGQLKSVSLSCICWPTICSCSELSSSGSPHYRPCMTLIPKELPWFTVTVSHHHMYPRHPSPLKCNTNLSSQINLKPRTTHTSSLTLCLLLSLAASWGLLKRKTAEAPSCNRSPGIMRNTNMLDSYFLTLENPFQCLFQYTHMCVNHAGDRTTYI